MPTIVVTRPSKDDLAEIGALDWPIWTCEPSQFDWSYDQKETCYILEGNVTVTAKDQEATFGPGDLVVFPKGLKCVWKVHAAVRKHYKFE